MRDDIVARLRYLGDHASYEPHVHHEAADEIERLLAREALLRRIIYDLLDDGDETDRTAARAALEDSYF